MPNYDYKCKACGSVHEIFQKITADPLTTCPDCKQETLQRGVGGGNATLRFLGTGFYITDYKDEKSCGCSKSSCDQ